jgi:hypothetical protein
MESHSSAPVSSLRGHHTGFPVALTAGLLALLAVPAVGFAEIRFGEPERIDESRTLFVSLVHLDDDGDLDLVSSRGDLVLVLRGDGDGGFKQRRVIKRAGGGAVASGDFDGDGRQDLATLDFLGKVSVFLGRGNTFLHASDVTVPTSAVSIASSDLNGDGRDDLVTSSYGVSSLTVLLSQGSARFTTRRYEAGSWPVEVEITDLDGDGVSDLVTSSLQAQAVSVLRGASDGSYGFHED